MNFYQSDSDNDTYYSYEDQESEYEYPEEEEEEEENVQYYDDEDEYFNDKPEVIDIKTMKVEEFRKPTSIPEINPWTGLKNTTENIPQKETRSFLDIIREEEILKKERDELEIKRKEKERINEKYRNSKRSSNRRYSNDKRSFQKNSSDRPVQSLLLSHRINTQKKGLKE